MSKAMITTFDNPFNPFEDFVSWFLFDEQQGYHSTSYLGRISRTSNQLSDNENDDEEERAIDEIIKHDFKNIYRKVRANEDFVFPVINHGEGVASSTPPTSSRRS